MKVTTLVKLNFLVLGFGLTLWAMYFINKNGLPSSLLTTFGMNPPKSKIENSIVESTVSWCETRVAALIKPNQFKLSQNRMKWLFEHSTVREANFVEIEKWFGRHCKIKAQLLNDTQFDRSEFSPILIVKFITDKVSPIYRRADGVFLWNNQVFKSKELDQAIADLSEIQKNL